LHRHHLPASDAEESLERVARLTAQTLDVPVALVTFLGKEWQWFNAAVGTKLDGATLDDSLELIVEMVESLLPSTRVAIMRLESDRLYHSAGSNVPDSLLPDASGA